MGILIHLVTSRAAICFITIGWTFSLVAAAPETDADGDQPADDNYEGWVQYYQKSVPALRDINTSPTQLQLVVMSVTRDEEKVNQERRFRTGGDIHGSELLVDGHVRRFSFTEFGAKGAEGGEPIPAADRARLSELLEKLPDDGSRLPPAGRRMLVKAAKGPARVYDRADAPDLVWDILRLSRSSAESWVPTFHPSGEINASRHQHGGFLCLSPDGRRILFTSMNGPVQFWGADSHKLLDTVVIRDHRAEDIVFSPNGELGIITGLGFCVVVETKTWQVIQRIEEPVVDRNHPGLFDPQFLRNGRYLLLHCTEPSLRFIDVQSWKQLDRLPEVPEDAVQYFPSRSGRRALVRSSAGDLLLRDVDQQREIAKLDQQSWIADVAFAPDKSLVAVVTCPKFVYIHAYPDQRVRIWNTDTGKLVHELRPFEHRSLEQAEGLAWTQNSQYLLVVTKSHSFFTTRGISVFNVKSGRHHGEFVECPTTVKGIAILPDRRHLVAGCIDGKIRFWDLEQELKEIVDFEKSIEPQHAPADSSDTPKRLIPP